VTVRRLREAGTVEDIDSATITMTLYEDDGSTEVQSSTPVAWDAGEARYAGFLSADNPLTVGALYKLVVNVVVSGSLKARRFVWYRAIEQEG
jgi:hypothetical protein